MGTYRSLANRLYKYTNGFTKEAGSFPLSNKKELEDATSILSTAYDEVDPHHLDVRESESHDGEVEYKVEFKSPKKRHKELEFMPDKAPGEVGPLSVNAGVGESLEENIEIHDTLNPDLFKDNEMIPEVKNKLLEIADKFKDNLTRDEVELDVKDIVVIGSNASYNYTDMSDIDLHIVSDMSKYEGIEDIVDKLYKAYKSLFNNKYDPTIKGHEVEVYVEPDSIHAKSNGMYSLINGWIKVPEREDIPEVDMGELEARLDTYIDRLNDVKTIEDIDTLINDLYKERQTGMLNAGEYDITNLLFKEMRNRGYLDKLKDMKVELENEEMSLEENMTVNDDANKLSGIIYDLNESLLEDSHDDVLDEAKSDYKFEFNDDEVEMIRNVCDSAQSVKEATEKAARYVFDNSSALMKAYIHEYFDEFYDAIESIAKKSLAKENHISNIKSKISNVTDKIKTKVADMIYEPEEVETSDIKGYYVVREQGRPESELVRTVREEEAEEVKDRHPGSFIEFIDKDDPRFDESLNESKYKVRIGGSIDVEADSEEEAKEKAMSALNNVADNVGVDSVDKLDSVPKYLHFVHNTETDDTVDMLDGRVLPIPADGYYTRDEWNSLEQVDGNYGFIDFDSFYEEEPEMFTNEKPADESLNEAREEISRDDLVHGYVLRRYNDGLASISKPRPYDDADYHYANLRGQNWLIAISGKVVEKLPADIEANKVAERLAELNKDINPRIIHDSYESLNGGEPTLDTIKQSMNEDLTDDIYDDPAFDELVHKFCGALKETHVTDEAVVMKAAADALSRIEVDPVTEKASSLNKEHEQEASCDLAESDSLTEDEEDYRKLALAKYLDVDPSTIEEDQFDNLYETESNDSYYVLTSDEAIDKASYELDSLIDDIGLEAFSDTFVDRITRDSRFFDMDAINEFINDEIDYFKDEENDPDFLHYLENLDTDDDKLQYIKDTLGPDSFLDWAKDHLNKEEIIDEVIAEDGVAGNIAFYDGREIELENNLYAYRVD